MYNVHSLETILLLQERLKHTIIIKQNTCVEFFSVIHTYMQYWLEKFTINTYFLYL